ncbi:MAG: hypothetical protein KBT88_08375 [Gammaproteobacteria bacterium]|nr:hypothetical protein [Gammaproteobacteria bacterium]MBQ0839789.1 hypothetical protein [Gammaproteobacteria bacterium]
MPRPASKKKPAKKVVKSTASSAGSAAEKVLEKALKQLDVQSGKLRIARDKLRVKRVAVTKNATAASTAALDKAYAAVTSHSVGHSELTNSVRLAKAEVRIESVLKKFRDAESTAQLRLEKAALTMAANSASELKAAVDKFEQRWLKQREQANAKKLKLAAARLRAKTKSIEKKSTSEAAAIRKRANKLSTKPVATPGRPGRPAGSVVKTTKAGAAPKRRGRPAKVVAKASASAEPKRRGRPPKAATTAVKKAVGTVTKSAEAPKRRGRPPKAKPAVAASAAKTASKPKVTAKKSTTASKAGAPKRRGRPPKVAKA